MILNSYRLIRIKQFLLCLFLIMVFSFPRELQNFKLLILVALLILNISNFSIISSKIKLLLLLFYSIIIFLVLFNGLILNNDFQLMFNSLKIVYFFPLLLFVIFSQFELNDLVNIIIKSTLYSLIISFVVNLSTLLFFLNLFPYNLNTFFYTQEDQIGFNQGFVHIINSSFSYWIFTIPLFFQSQILKFNKIKLFFLLLLFFISVVSGRRMLMLPFIVFLISSSKSRKILVGFILTTVLFLLNDFVREYLDFEVILDRFNDAINSSGDSEIRMIQSKRFLEYIDLNPLNGYGMGSYMPDFMRSIDFRTAYESSYHYLFFERGIPLGLATIFLYLFLLIGIYRNINLDYQFRKGFVLATITLLIASYTNPYWLSSFDYCVPFALTLRLFPNKLL